MKLPEQKLEDDQGIYEWNTVYTMPMLPEISDGIMLVDVYPGSNQDYKGRHTAAKYKSNDMGKTWYFIEEIRTDDI
ncbi:hypothetical protein D3C71_2061990 [compost metagenome]